MAKNETYYLHQTPKELAKDLMKFVPITNEDILYEPFKGEGAFYDAFPEHNTKLWAEINDGVDYKDITEPYDWIITNPPFRLDSDTGRVNAFWTIINYFSDKATKGMAFLGNDYCFSTLTPKRLEILNNKGWYIQKIVVSSVKKWRGRYFFIILTKKENTFYNYLLTNY
jgi:hypothetical protein